MDSIGCGKIVDVHAQIGDMEVLFAIYQVSEECMDLVFW